jgi:hypothetical protein
VSGCTASVPGQMRILSTGLVVTALGGARAQNPGAFGAPSGFSNWLQQYGGNCFSGNGSMWSTSVAYNKTAGVNYVSIRADPDKTRGVTNDQGVFTAMYTSVACVGSNPGDPYVDNFPNRGCGGIVLGKSVCVSTFWVPDSLGGAPVLAMFATAPDNSNQNQGDPCHSIAGNKMLNWTYAQTQGPSLAYRIDASLACPPGVSPNAMDPWEAGFIGECLLLPRFLWVQWSVFAALACAGAVCLFGFGGWFYLRRGMPRFHEEAEEGYTPVRDAPPVPVAAAAPLHTAVPSKSGAMF